MNESITDQFSRYLRLATLGASTIIFVSLGFLVLLRQGLDNSFWQEGSALAGLGLFLLCIPHFIKSKVTKERNWLWNDSTISMTVLFIFCGLGYAKIPQLSISISAVGYVLFVRLVIRSYFVRKHWLYYLGCILIFLFFSIWVVSTIWGGLHLRPTFLETLTVTKNYFLDDYFFHVDTLFHSSIAQMLKNYGTASTGLDGIPSFYYHYGSHWLFARISGLTGIAVIDCYNLGYLLVILPMFFKTFIELTLVIQRVTSGRLSMNLFYVALFFCLFIQFPKHLYSGGLLGISFIVNESYTLSLLFLAVFVLGWLSVLDHTKKDPVFTFCWITVGSPILLGIIGFIKISTAFVVTGLMYYLILRLGLFRKGIYVVGLFIGTVFFLCVYFLTAESIPFGIRAGGSEGTQTFFHFYTSTHTFDLYSWGVLFYGWIYFLFLFALAERSRSQTSWIMTMNSSLPFEIAFVIALIGLVPSLVMVFSGGNSMYFSGVQITASGALVLGLVPRIQDYANDLFRKVKPSWRRLIIVILLIAFAIHFYSQVRGNFNDMLKINVYTRRELLGIPHDPEERFDAFNKKNWELIGRPIQSALNASSFYSFLSMLKKLDLSDQRTRDKTLLFFNFQERPSAFFGELPCYNQPFVLTALSGYALLDGIPYECTVGNYGENYYRRNFEGQPAPNNKELCALMEKREFERLLKFEFPTGQIKLVDCK